MTKHDLLFFIVALKDHLRGEVKMPHDEAYWPTKKQLQENIALNETFFPDYRKGTNTVARRLAGEGLLAIGPCCEHCHAEHYRATPLGLKILERWNREGCTSGKRNHQNCRVRRHKLDFDTAA